MGSVSARVHFGMVSCGSASGPELRGPTDWQCLEQATALPRVGLLDGPECSGKAERPRWHTAADKHDPPCQSWPSPTCWQVEKIGPCRTHIWSPSSFLPKKLFLQHSVNRYTCLTPHFHVHSHCTVQTTSVPWLKFEFHASWFILRLTVH